MLQMEMLWNARGVLSGVINKTPLIPAGTVGNGGSLYLKAECLQKTGAFKLRGAYYKIATLTEEEKKRGVIACSAGNHAQGVALSAQRNGIKAVICLPDGAPISKVEATKSYGAEVCLVEGVYDDAYRRGVKKRFVAMAYAYALDCDVRQILEPTNKLENEGWDEPCLPGCEL